MVLFDIRCAKPAERTITLQGKPAKTCASCSELFQQWHADNAVPQQRFPTGRGTSRPRRMVGVDHRTRIGTTALSAREKTVLASYASGIAVKTIARELEISESTVWQYIQRIKTKYEQMKRGAASRMDLYARAVEDGLLEAPASPGDRAAADHSSADPVDRVERVRPVIVRYAQARLGVNDVAADAAHDILSELLDNPERIPADPNAALRYVFSVARPKVDEARPKALEVLDVPIRFDSGWPGWIDHAQREEHETSDGTQPAKSAPLTIDIRKSMSKLLTNLKPEQREVLVLRVLVGLGTDATASAMGIAPGRVRILQHRALTRLRTLSTIDDL